ncbi:hypothetical protein [Streptomyces sp. NPDC052225]|uniref:hypothetical protein n=1 Tax=Streptomyces sp. NPDC052225 TaxID=3154949 RepID=UPI00341F9910
MTNDKHGKRGFSSAPSRLGGESDSLGSVESLARVDDRNWRSTYLLTATVTALVAVRALMVIGMTVASVGSGYATSVVVASAAALLVVGLTVWLLIRARQARTWRLLLAALAVCVAGLIVIAVAGRL